VKIAKYPRLCNAANGSLQRECEGYVFGELWTNAFVRDAHDLSPRHVTSNSLDQFQLNDDGLLVAVGKNGSWTDQKWGTNVVVDGISYHGECRSSPAYTTRRVSGRATSPCSLGNRFRTRRSDSRTQCCGVRGISTCC
jgi:hypothetical protein